MREGGVEPPRPCGHWNLNPARLPIPPPAHWVCPQAPFLAVSAPSDMQKISTVERVASHHLFPAGPAARRRDGSDQHGPNTRALGPRINECWFTYQPRTGPGHLHRRGTGRTVRCGTLVTHRLYDPWQSSDEVVRRRAPAGIRQRDLSGHRHRMTPVDRADRGNQPISWRVDTISKQYRLGTQSGDDGGGAPWES